jgi:hypothetical protein
MKNNSTESTNPFTRRRFRWTDSRARVEQSVQILDSAFPIDADAPYLSRALEVKLNGLNSDVTNRCLIFSTATDTNVKCQEPLALSRVGFAGAHNRTEDRLANMWTHRRAKRQSSEGVRFHAEVSFTCQS